MSSESSVASSYASDPVPSSDALVEAAAQEATFTELLLNLRGNFMPFNLPTTEAVILAVTELFPFDSEIIDHSGKGVRDITVYVCPRR